MISQMSNESKMRDNIIETISHEFMTPLNGQILLLNLLKNDKLIKNTKSEQYVSIAL